MKKIVLDCSCQKNFNEIKDGAKVYDLLMSTAVTYDYSDDTYRFWTSSNKDELSKYLCDNLVIGYNSMSFDSPIIIGSSHKLANDGTSIGDNVRWKNYDLFVEIKKRLYRTVNDPIQKTFETMKKNFNLAEKGVYTLGGVCTATFGNPKYNMKDNSVELFKQRKILDLINFNLNQTRMIKKLYEFSQKFGYIVNANFDIVKF